MTISSTVRTAGPYTGNGSSTDFSFAFKVFTTSDVVVIERVTETGVETTLELNTDYTVSLNADQNGNPGGTVSLSTALPSTETVTITSSVANLQTVDLTNQGGFYPEVINSALDRSVIQVQQLNVETSRSIRFPISDGFEDDDGLLPSKENRALKFIYFDEDGYLTTASTILGTNMYAENYVSGTVPTVTGYNAIGFGAGSQATDSYAIAIGQNNQSTGSTSVSIGYNNQSTYPNSVAIGNSSESKQSKTVAIGSRAKARGDSAISIGTPDSGNNSTDSDGTRSIAIGSGAVSNATASVAIGEEADATGTSAISIGKTAVSSSTNSVCIGVASTASNTASTVVGYDLVASGQQSVSVGAYNESIGTASVTIGSNCLASGAYSTAIGRYSNATGWGGVALGYLASAASYGKFSFSSGKFANNGDAQTGIYVMRAITTDATQSDMSADGGPASSSNIVNLSNDSTYFFRADIVARDIDNDGVSAAYTITGCIDRGTNAASTALVGSITKTVIAEDVAGWDVTAVADTTNGGLVIKVTGAEATNIFWVATVHTTEVIG